jgi:hypothetical protein
MAITTSASSERGEIFSGALLAAGALSLFIGTLFYIRLTPQLGLPTLASERTRALTDALALGPQRLLLAGGWAFLGDWLLVAACVALARHRNASDLAASGWALVGVSAALAMAFDSMTAVVFWPLAQGPDASPFLALKAWFDFLFASADVPFGVGAIAVLATDTRRVRPLLPRPLSYFGMAIGAAAAASGAAYVIGVEHLPRVMGLTVTLECVVLAALGVQIARAKGSPGQMAQTVGA